jgi:hypothetical protein
VTTRVEDVGRLAVDTRQRSTTVIARAELPLAATLTLRAGAEWERQRTRTRGTRAGITAATAAGFRGRRHRRGGAGARSAG